jgi:hypothetical protein
MLTDEEEMHEDLGADGKTNLISELWNGIRNTWSFRDEDCFLFLALFNDVVSTECVA